MSANVKFGKIFFLGNGSCNMARIERMCCGTILISDEALNSNWMLVVSV